MSKSRAQDLLDLGNTLFTQKDGLHGLCQEIAELFFPARADFTTSLDWGATHGEQNDDSYPQLLHRQLSDSFSAWLRPKDRAWFRCTTLDDRIDADEENARYLEYVTATVRRKLYDPRSKFIRATKEGDLDYAAFGQCVISMEEAPNRSHLYMRTHHFRDCAWLENEIGDIDHLHRKDSMTARKLKATFGEKALHENIKQACEKNPSQPFPIRVIVMPADEYDYTGPGHKAAGGRKLPFTICYVDVNNCKILKEGALPDFNYIVPRWQTRSGSPYAFSPATMTALPDARMIETLARILLEAGEKAVDPPLIATEEAVRDISTGAGGVSWIDYAYDEKLGEALRPLKISGDMRTGFAMRQDLRELLKSGFYIDKLTLPEAGKDMTAYEVARRLEEHVRNLLPIFEPIEVEYNSRLLDKAFTLLRNMNTFDLASMPDALSKRDITWAFESPIQQASSRLLAERAQETLTAVHEAKQFGLITASPVYEDQVFKDRIRGIGGPATWRKTAAEEQAEAEAAENRRRLAGMAQELATAGDVASKLGGGIQQLQAAAAGAGGQPGEGPAPVDKSAKMKHSFALTPTDPALAEAA